MIRIVVEENDEGVEMPALYDGEEFVAWVSEETAKNVEVIDVLTNLVSALLERVGGTVILSRKELEQAATKTFKYEIHGESVVIEWS